ncbi:Alpha/Beta hydrolase protein [Phaeosphaeriaceae sp. PMI808]|nr:Alpha/Beta hydrolase protein [Phaeosphaeriaceae sp. PMI808]
MAEWPPNLSLDKKQGSPTMSFSTRWLRRRLVLIMVFFATTLLLFGYFGSFGLGLPYSQYPTPDTPTQFNGSLVIKVPGYGSFQGTQVLTNLKKTTTFRSLVNAWLGVEYSSQPIGQARFKAVGLPGAFDGTKDATAFGPACWQNIYSSLSQSEACLTISVFRPSRIPLGQKLPVLVYLHGGSFVTGSHRSFDGALFVEKSEQPLMVVTVQYRLGALGGLPGKFMEEENLLNLGVRDQRTALEFLHQHVESFGGDPKKITLSGQSAGGHSVGIHLFHNYGTDTGNPLFQQVILSSGSPTARAFPGVDYPLYQEHVKSFMDYVNCPASPAAAALECLRSAEVDDIQFISTSLYTANNYNITWPWQPVSPGPLFEKRGSQSGEEGTFFAIPMMIASMTDEGTGFVPQNLRTNAEYLNFWKTLTPNLSAQDFADLQTLYPDVKASENPAGTFISAQFERLSTAYGDYSYICPVQDTASRLSSAGAAVYKARFNTPNYSSTFLGVPHASDGSYFNGEEDVRYPEIAKIYQSYWASFVVGGDPNQYASAGSAKWEKYEVGNGKAGRQLAVNRPSEGGPKMENEEASIRMEQCNWWRDEERAKRLNK